MLFHGDLLGLLNGRFEARIFDGLLEDGFEFVYFGMAFGLQLAVQQPAIDDQLEAAPIAGNQCPFIDVRFKISQHRVRHPDGTREVFSNRAVGQRDFEHEVFSGLKGLLIQYNRGKADGPTAQNNVTKLARIRRVS
jgi:hypothetical protein